MTMAKQILFVQGAGANAHDGWDRKLVESLKRTLGPDHPVRYPRMPDEAHPRYAIWKPALVRELGRLEDGAILVGHSVGGTILLHLLAEQPAVCKPGVLVLIAAPFIGDGGWPSDELPSRSDFAQRLPAGLPVLLYHGTDDQTVPVAHAHLHARAIPQATVHVLPGRDHQLNNDLGEVAKALRLTTTSPAPTVDR